MININKLFTRNPGLLDKSEVKKLITYIQELEGKIFESNLVESKEHVYRSMTEEILNSCREYEDNKLLVERYPNLYEKIDSDEVVKNLLNYILEMNRVNNLNL